MSIQHLHNIRPNYARKEQSEGREYHYLIPQKIWRGQDLSLLVEHRPDLLLHSYPLQLHHMQKHNIRFSQNNPLHPYKNYDHLHRIREQ